MREECVATSLSAALIRCGEPCDAPAVERCVEMALSLGQTDVVLDLGESIGADSETLRSLHRSARRVRQSGGRLSVVCADAGLRRLLDITLLSQSFTVYETREEALAR